MSVTNTMAMLLAQQGQGGTAYNIGQIAGVIFLIVLAGAVLRSFLKTK